MSFLVRRLIRTERQTGQKQYRELRFNTSRLTVGSGVDQHLQVPDPKVAAAHAEISLNARGQLSIKALTSEGFEVNGQPVREAKLKPGDSLRIGSLSLSVEEPQGDFQGVLSCSCDIGPDEERLENIRVTSLTQAGLRKAPWAWFAGITALLLFILIPLLGVFDSGVQEKLRESPILPDDSLWLSGPMHPSHQFFGDDCTACHTKPFKMVKNEQCEECHQGVQHHVAVDSKDVELFEQGRCAGCHREHNEPSILVEQDPRGCTDCHEALDQLKEDTELGNATDFGANHPAFRLALLTATGKGAATEWQPVRYELKEDAPLEEKSNLTFSHKDHLDPEGIESPDGDQVLDCADCHELEGSGKRMKPVTMEKQCSRCHSLLFDENDLNTTVPHGDPKQVFDALVKHFSHVYLEQRTQTEFKAKGVRSGRRPGGETRALTREEQQQALDWAQKQSVKVAAELLENRLCVDCHQVSRDTSKTGIEQWTVEPIGLTTEWMPATFFEHASHYTTESECTDCHHDADKSEMASDVLMPTIDDCRQCHGGPKDVQKVASDCLMCHRFHLPGKGVFDPEERKAGAESGKAVSMHMRLIENRS